MLLLSCGQRTPTPQDCKALNEPKAVLQRCYGGDLENGKYVGDLKCWPFSKAQRLQGIWLIALEASAFYPSAKAVKEIDHREPNVWLETDLLAKRADLLASAQGAEARAYAVDFEGRQALCDGMFGHFGMYPRQVIAERFYSMRRLALPNQ